jgi:hypothetical protein
MSNDVALAFRLSAGNYPAFWNIIENCKIAQKCRSVFCRSKIKGHIAILFVVIVVDVLDDKNTPNWN